MRLGNRDGAMLKESARRTRTRAGTPMRRRRGRSGWRASCGQELCTKARDGAAGRGPARVWGGVTSDLVRQADIDGGLKPGVTTEAADRIAALEQENRELRRANEILKRASAFFAAELDRPQK